MCGGGIPIVSDVVDAVSDVFDKADNWTEGAGDLLADIDPGPAIGDAGEWIDQSVLQPMLDDPLATVATVAAITTQQYWALPIIAGTKTAAAGGDLEDIAKSVGVAFVAAQAAPYVQGAMPAATTIGGKIAVSAATGAVVGAGTGATAAAVQGTSVGEAATKGAVIGGVSGAVSSAVNQGYQAVKTEFGITGGYSPNIKADSEFVAAQAESARAAGAGEAQIADILKQEGVQAFAADDVASLTASGVGEKAVAQNVAASYDPMEVYTPPVVKDNIFEKEGKKLLSKAITGEILEEIYDPQQGFIQRPVARRRFSTSGTEGMGETDLSSADNTADLAQVTPSKYELRKFINDAGNSTLVSFKDDKPQTPIPSGYREVETIGAAKGGLIDSQPSTTMVKYSKKPLIAQRKKETKIAKKGLASRK